MGKSKNLYKWKETVDADTGVAAILDDNVDVVREANGAFFPGFWLCTQPFFTAGRNCLNILFIRFDAQCRKYYPHLKQIFWLTVKKMKPKETQKFFSSRLALFNTLKHLTS